MPYIIETCKAGKTYEICKYHSYRYHVRGEKRGKKEKPSSDAQKKVNQRKAEKELRRSMNENFQDGDSLVRLDFSKANYPVGSEEIQRAMSEFLKKLRKAFRKRGRELKYIYVKEIGKRGGRHVHIIMSKVDTDTLMECWPFGGIHLDPLISNGQYAKIAAYFIKYAAKTEETEGKLIGKRWNPSRNLRRPVPKKEVVSANTYRERSFKKLEGYYLDEDSVQVGISEFTGYGYFSYTLIQDDRFRQQQKEEKGQRKTGKDKKRRTRKGVEAVGQGEHLHAHGHQRAEAKGWEGMVHPGDGDVKGTGHGRGQAPAGAGHGEPGGADSPPDSGPEGKDRM